MAVLLKGAPVSAALTEKLRKRCEALKNKGVVPTLAILRIGEETDDLSYERGAMKRCGDIGICVKNVVLPATASETEVLGCVEKINEDPFIHGCLMLRHKNTSPAACEALDPKKDVDGMTGTSLAATFTGKGEGFPPCTAQAVMELLDFYGIDLTGKRVAVIGRSLVVGKPLSMLLLNRNATVTMCHTKTLDIAKTVASAEILVSSAGAAGLVTKEFVSKEQILVDVGINVNEEGKLCGDAAFAEVEPIVSAITPVPGGVGAVTTAVLAKHVIEAAEAAGIREGTDAAKPE